jgi:hypothetical protein
VVLDLEGNAWRDLAGTRLTFINPDPPKPRDLDGFFTDQMGTTGDITASRKVRVPDISMEELMERYEKKESFPWHWGNSLYLEWFSLRNGRVVIESANYELVISPDRSWEMTEAEEEEQRIANGRAMEGFMDRVAELLAKAEQSDSDEDDDQDPPLSEVEQQVRTRRRPGWTCSWIESRHDWIRNRKMEEIPPKLLSESWKRSANGCARSAESPIQNR